MSWGKALMWGTVIVAVLLGVIAALLSDPKFLMILSAPLRPASAPDVRSTCAPTAPNQRTHGSRCSVSPGLTRVSRLRPIHRLRLHIFRQVRQGVSLSTGR